MNLYRSRRSPREVLVWTSEPVSTTATTATTEEHPPKDATPWLQDLDLDPGHQADTDPTCRSTQRMTEDGTEVFAEHPPWGLAAELWGQVPWDLDPEFTERPQHLEVVKEQTAPAPQTEHHSQQGRTQQSSMTFSTLLYVQSSIDKYIV